MLAEFVDKVQLMTGRNYLKVFPAARYAWIERYFRNNLIFKIYICLLGLAVGSL